MTGLLVIMGSGETAPTMIKTHRMLFERLGPAPAVLLDTPYGFQTNADDISARAVEYFAVSVGRTVEAAELRRARRCRRPAMGGVADEAGPGPVGVRRPRQPDLCA